MSPDTLAIIGTILGAAGVLATLITTTTGRLSTRLTAVEKETSRLSGLLEGLGLTGRLPPSAAPDRPA